MTTDEFAEWKTSSRTLGPEETVFTEREPKLISRADAAGGAAAS
jgi:hypothetical protein